MSKPLGVVFLFDVDNTLIDNDRVQADLRKHLALQRRLKNCNGNSASSRSV